ncbi:hypothetical protein EGW08_003633 [Elysia chlorotica]|uniref:UspA domain-containing protein n=1 Tax=Elysia chlorotica TaxID=188477 RepID=A0A3S1ACU1_ELYCH|nr:hypothetical protein EGW08_003633 [Elysia chlorotica]
MFFKIQKIWYVQNFHKPENKVVVVHTPEYSMGPSEMSTSKIEESIQEANAKTEMVKTKFVEKMSECGVGTRGLGKFRRTMLGSVSDYILHHAHVPVLVCRLKYLLKDDKY